MDLWLCGVRVQKRDNGLCLPFFLGQNCPDPLFDTGPFSFSLYVTGAFQAAILVLELRESELSKSMCGFFKGNCLGVQKFLPLT